MSQHNAENREPLIHLSKRSVIHPAKAALIRLAAVLLGLIVCGLVAFLLIEKIQEKPEKIIKALEVVAPNTNTPVRRLSGGNVQKVLVGREIAYVPKVLMAAYPVRGLDINSSYTIYNLLNAQKERGGAVIFVGEDLDVLLALCDRIMVINSGAVTGIVDARTATKEEIGLLMTKTDNVGKEAAQ